MCNCASEAYDICEFCRMKERLAELERMLAEAPTVTGIPNFGKTDLVWAFRWENSRSDITHRARLVQIEELPK